jgi:hypothetical protein
VVKIEEATITPESVACIFNGLSFLAANTAL